MSSAQIIDSDTRYTPYRLYFNWIFANATAEAIGIGTAAFIAVQMTNAQTDISKFHPLVLFLCVVLAGTFIEGILVGLFQGISIRDIVSIRKWVLYTTLGAGIAWILGMLPNTLIELFSSNQAELIATTDRGINMAEMNPVLTLVLAAGMGLVLGPFLAIPQWLVLKTNILGPTWQWIPANMIAWAAGMMFIFGSMDFMPVNSSFEVIALWGIMVGAITGIIVGAIHGLILVRLVN